MLTWTRNPLKRKTPPSEDGERSFTPAADGPSQPKDEYETGRVNCEVCGDGVSFRDEATGGFTLKHWNDHRVSCVTPSPTATSGDPAIYSPEAAATGLVSNAHSQHPPAKRRRAKRTEEERIEYLRADPYVAQFEAYRVLCASCDKWIRLRPNSTYCSIPWDAHRKSCLAKKINSKNVYALEERNTLFSKDPDVRKFDAERVLCNMCDQWFPLNPDDHLQAVQAWLQHRSTCQKSSTTLRYISFPSRYEFKLTFPSNSPSVRAPGQPSPPTSMSGTPAAGPSHLGPAGSPPILSLSLSASALRSPSFHDLNPANYAPAHESRRRNAEQRAATLRADTLIGEVEPNRVFCSLCQKWVQLRQDSSYCAYPWLQHRGKCLARHQRRAQKAAEIAEARARKLRHSAGGSHAHSPSHLTANDAMSASDAEDDVESEEGVEPEDERMQVDGPPRPGYREIKREPDDREERHHHHHHRHPTQHRPHHQHSHSHPHPHQQGQGSYEEEEGQEQGRRRAVGPALGRRVLADLDSVAGRRHFIHASITHLFGTTYEASDEMRVAALLTYLNAAAPPDKHEDFDTGEVVRALAALQDRGRVRLEGDLVKVVA
ncbi:hypothetical protein FPV67DRAFT_1411888 [Lyophyllum atratum]|nr:hypothetical protein FPV67DRAFT_1411888 [Lyophyllum atratum]